MQKKDVAKMLKRIKESDSSCVIGEVLIGESPRRKDFSYIKKKGFFVRRVGEMTFLVKGEGYADDTCIKIAQLFKAY